MATYFVSRSPPPTLPERRITPRRCVCVFSRAARFLKVMWGNCGSGVAEVRPTETWCNLRRDCRRLSQLSCLPSQLLPCGAESRN